MIREITAKTLLSSSKKPDPWFGIKYTMNLYRGCQHQCIYCDSRSTCYRIEDFTNDVLVKVNAIDLLRAELPRKRVIGTVGTGSMDDPYMTLEATWNLTGQALRVIAEHHFPIHIITKSALVLRDLDIVKKISQVYAAVSFTITTADDDLGKKIEPGASLVSKRFQAIEKLATNDILTGVTMMPILPFIEDTEENIRAIVTRAHESGAKYILPAFGMTMREGQREYFYAQLDRLFPGIRATYERRFGDRYECAVNNAKHLARVFSELCDQLGIATHMPHYTPQIAQPALF
ncbi:MAG: radical SAM protein [Chloroflexi bacterium]|nr:radical SAM protein [Chloroflexota bacterium]